MNYECNRNRTDYGPNPYVIDMKQSSGKNQNFRTTVWTGCHLQMTVMSILPREDIGFEVHEDTDQFIRIEQGNAVVKMGSCRCQQEFQRRICEGDAVFVPAGTWHNVINVGQCPLKVSSIYTPPNHRPGTVHRTKADAGKEEY